MLGRKKLSFELSKEHGINTIGVWGMQKGSGVTHTAIVIASYLAQVLRGKVIYAEYNSSGQIVQMLRELDAPPGDFYYGGIHFYSRVLHHELWNLMEPNSGTMVVDCGTATKIPPKEFELFQKKIIVMDGALWKQMPNEDWLERYGGQKKYQYVIPGAQNQDTMSIARRYGCDVYSIPYQKSTFELTLPMMHAIHTILS